MRLYTFCNLYISPIQCGIQTAHVVHDLFVKYYDSVGEERGTLYNWAEDHKTIIVCNAGYSSELRSLIDLFHNKANPYPWADFREGENALDGALTCVGIVLPEKIYDRHNLVVVPRGDSDSPIGRGLDAITEWINDPEVCATCDVIHHKGGSLPQTVLTLYEVILAHTVAQYKLA